MNVDVVACGVCANAETARNATANEKRALNFMMINGSSVMTVRDYGGY
jgi:hypothetical protein